MRLLGLTAALAILAACSERTSEATYTCPRGPDLAVRYSDEGATVYFPDGRIELLPRPDPERQNLYAKPGYRFVVFNREARLDDSGKSYTCDQMTG